MKGRIKARSLNVTIAARSQPTGVELVDTTSVGRQCVAMASNVTIAARWLQGRRYAEIGGNEIWPQHRDLHINSSTQMETLLTTCRKTQKLRGKYV